MLTIVPVSSRVWAYTSGSSYADGTESWKGRLAPGFVADLVVLSEDPWEIPAEHLADVEVMLTMVDGKIVYRAPIAD